MKLRMEKAMEGHRIGDTPEVDYQVMPQLRRAKAASLPEGVAQHCGQSADLCCIPRAAYLT